MNNGKMGPGPRPVGPGGPRPGQMGPRGEKPDAKTVKRTFAYLLDYKWRLIAVVICIIISALVSVVSSLFLKTLIDGYIKPLLTESSPDYSGLLVAILTMGGIYLVGVLAGLTYNLIMATVTQGILKNIRDKMFAHMQTLPIKYFDTNTHGDIMSRYTNDTDTLRMMISQSIPQSISAVITIVSVFVSMIILSPWLTLLVVGLSAVTVLLSGKIVGRSGTHFVRQQKCLGDMNGYIEEMISGQKVIKVFCHEDEAKTEFDRRNEELCGAATEANKYANYLGPIMNNMGHLQYVIIAIVGGALAISGVGGLTVGSIASFLQLSKSFNQPISQVSQQFNAIIMALAGAKRIFEIMDEPSETDEGYVTLVNAEEKDGVIAEADHRTGMWAWKHPHSDGSVTYTKLAGQVRLSEVDFGYTEDKMVLHDITIYAEPGQKVAFVGATGAGKTTITNLINRFYDIADGKIRYDGININKIKKADLRRSLGIVLQDVNLFTGTVMDNIRYGKLDATDEECIAAAKLAGADWFISMMPDGYNTVIDGSGSDLSQGQRQLISIARAAVADPPVMILDEATSSIDTRTESIVQAGMDRLMHGRTVFVIAHRLSTVRNSDVIMVLDHGRIIERGSHDQLIAEKGQYYRLYTGAFELE